jgi:hypothetical protein
MKLRRRLLTVALTALLALTGVACDGNGDGDDDGDDDAVQVHGGDAVQAVAALTVG